MSEKLVIIPRVKKIHEKQQNEEIQPKKLQNPCKESKERRELHKELLWREKSGSSPLNKKTELEKAIAKVKAEKPVVIETKDEFSRVLLERKKRLEEVEVDEKEDTPEFLKVFRRIHKGGDFEEGK